MVSDRHSVQSRRRARGGYRIDLSDLHAQCEANYHRLMRLFPEYEQQSACVFAAGEVSVSLEVTARDRYTTDMRLRYQGMASAPWAGSCFDLRLYHDARMAEVVHCSTSRRFEARYRYPNPEMLQRDEKFQQNRFAAELMEFCLSHGRSLETNLSRPDPTTP
jgi:uncharacterized protein YqiB (DUF1249 family)